MPRERESHCPICLQDISRAAFLDPCHHQYCRDCIKQWAKHKHTCPICQQSFKHIRRVLRDHPQEKGNKGKKTKDNKLVSGPTKMGLSDTTIPEEDLMEEEIFQILNGRSTRQGNQLFLDLFTRLETIVEDL